MDSSSPKRKKPLERRSGLKRTGGLKRSAAPKRKHGFNSRYRPTDKAIETARIRSKKEFREAAAEQQVCAMCGRADTFDAHHVVEAQHLKLEGHPVYVRANALRLCDRFSKNKCHQKHTNGSRKLRLKELSDENIEYAFAVLGPGPAEVYLRRHYSGNDPRIEREMERYGARQ